MRISKKALEVAITAMDNEYYALQEEFKERGLRGQKLDEASNHLVDLCQAINEGYTTLSKEEE